MNGARESMFRQRISEMESRISHLERILRLTQVINSTLTLGPLLDIIVLVATELTHTGSASIMLIDKETGELRFAAVTGQKSSEVKPEAVPIEGSIAGTVIQQNKPLLIRDARQDSRWYQNVDQKSGYVTREIIAVPMQVRGQVIGVVEALNKVDGASVTWDDVEILTTLANQAAIAIQNARLLTELQHAYDNLNELDQMKSDFIAVAAHELRTPLSLILGYAVFLKEDASGVAKEQINVVLQSAMRLRSLIDDMINLQGIDSGEATLDLEQVCVQKLIVSVVEEIRSLAEAKDQTVSLCLLDESVYAQLDRSKMHIVLVNLLSNAIKFTGSGGRIGVQVHRQDDCVRFTVWDTGIGIPLKKQAHIFDRFYQVETSLARHYEGMGLGLAIVKEMVELHGGYVSVRSKEGRGSAFTVTLPSQPPA